jgi:hypothetical protein
MEAAVLAKTFPIVAPVPMTLLPARVWAQEQWERIKLGYRARSMDEKWNVFVEDHVAFLHRNWTGRGMFEASFSPIDGGWHVSAAVAESERVRNVSAQLNRVLLELVLSAIVLGEPAADLRAELVKLFLPHDRPAPPEGAIEHSILGLRSSS